MAQIGNRLNSYLNGEWCRHARWYGKREAAGARRAESKEIILNELNPKDDIDKTFDIYYENMKRDNLFEFSSIVEVEQMVALISDDKPQLFPLEELCIKKAA